MKFLILLLACAVVGLVIFKQREGFRSEFLDNGNVNRTAQTSASSYEQETNHFKLETGDAFGPLHGVETPFRVNMYNSYSV